MGYIFFAYHNYLGFLYLCYSPEVSIEKRMEVAFKFILSIIVLQKNKIKTECFA